MPVPPLNATTFCARLGSVCEGAFAQYADMDECVRDVASLPPFGRPPCTFAQGNAIGCRGFHLDMARLRPAQHCPHAGPTWAKDPDGQRKCVDDLCPTYNPVIHDPRFEWFPIHDEIRSMC